MFFVSYFVCLNASGSSANNPNDSEMLEKMIEKSAGLTSEEALGVIRVINVALSLINAAEVQHRLRTIKMHEKECFEKDETVGPLYHTEDSVRGSIDVLLQSGQATKDQIYEALSKQSVELVLTAHPTEVSNCLIC